MSTKVLTMLLLFNASIVPISDTASAQSPVKRRFHRQQPQLVASIGDRAGVELYMPGAIASTPAGSIVVFDRGDMNVRAFSVDGSELWRFGREGGGPGEFRGVTVCWSNAAASYWWPIWRIVG